MLPAVADGSAAVSATMRGWRAAIPANAAFGQRSAVAGNLPGGNSRNLPAGQRSAIRRAGLQRGASGSWQFGQRAGAPIDWTSMMSYIRSRHGEAWDPPGSLQPAANSGFPRAAAGRRAGAGGVATSTLLAVSNFPGTPWGQPSTSGRAGAAIRRLAGLSWWQASNRWRRGNRGVQSGGSR